MCEMSESPDKTPDNRAFQRGISKIDSVASHLEIPKYVQDAAKNLFQNAVNAELTSGHTHDTLATASLYIACRRFDFPRSVHDTQSVTDINGNDIKNTYRSISKELELEIEPVPPNLFVARFCKALELDDEIEDFANEVIETAVEQNLHSGRAGPAMAAGAIYGACKLLGKEITQATVSDVCGVSTATIRSRYQEMLEAYEE